MKKELFESLEKDYSDFLKSVNEKYNIATISFKILFNENGELTFKSDAIPLPHKNNLDLLEIPTTELLESGEAHTPCKALIKKNGVSKEVILLTKRKKGYTFMNLDNLEDFEYAEFVDFFNL